MLVVRVGVLADRFVVVRSSDEALVMGVERRGRVVRDVFVLVNQEDWEELG